MVRHCAVGGCRNTDLSMLCHRFPRRVELFDQWRKSLDLEHLDDEELYKRAVVCTFHFKPTDYRNPKSRMLNSVAIPTLTLYKKGPFYDTPTTSTAKGAFDSAFDQAYSRKLPMGVQMPKIEQAARMTVGRTESYLSVERLETPVEQQQQQPADEEVYDIIEPIEVLEDEDDCVYFIEEQEESPVIVDDASPEVTSNIENENSDDDDDSLSPQAPEAKRMKADDCSVEEPENPTQSTEYQNATVQTDEVQFLSREEQLQRRMADEFYPAYAGHSRLELIKQLKEKEERMAEMARKLANIEMAHAAMMKTMEAFKSIMK